MNNQDQVPTIAGLWHEADGLIRLSIPHLEKLASPDYQVNEDMRPIYVQQLASCNERLHELRQQLVERCSNVPDKSGYYTSFFIIEHSLNVSFHDTSGAWIIQSRHDNADSSREMSAAYAFWAWELEQSQPLTLWKQGGEEG